ncbi:hypothetical protein B0T18DRAFT_374299 [Schizothecium vesticola]|uniref:serine--tRNA ligase n=1 Tax=Schizothecium vesticola TaxID=314040 RepID=A0AA40K021_9PEZI|nr:hypothetical protein B0T18DRAFT_374299 [Schizothecium vesticola]
MKPPGHAGRQLAWPLLGPGSGTRRALCTQPQCRPHPRPHPRAALYHTSPPLRSYEPGDVPRQTRSPTAPKPHLDMRHIRDNPELYAENCRERNYPAAAAYPARINDLFAQWHDQRRQARDLRVQANLLRRQIANPGSLDTDESPEALRIRGLTPDERLAEGRTIKAALASIEAAETRLTADMDALALALPNLTSPLTPRGSTPRLLTTIHDDPSPSPDPSPGRSHVDIGTELQILDFPAARKTSGWGWYYLVSAAAELEQALILYALARARAAGFTQVSPPSLVYADIASACGFQPRDVDGLTQIYPIAQPPSDRSPPLVLAGTAEIPLAAMLADTTLPDPAALPLRRVAVSRCYRAEAGARGVDTKGLYRVHEFTKVELFTWTAPTDAAVTEAFDDVVDLQTEILWSLGLRCRVLEMPSTDLGAAASRKVDIEAYFPSRRERDGGWGEVTSASICTDYQTRRLGTRMARGDGGGEGLMFPWTVNGTALAVPRVLAAILENGWDERERTVKVPEVLRPWMGGREKIGPAAGGGGIGRGGVSGWGGDE